MYKGRPLPKPTLIVASDGYIIDFLGPYLAKGKNKYATILKNHLSKKQCNNIFKWSQSNDGLVLDRGFRDSLELIDSLNLRPESPSFLGKGQKQHTEANTTTIQLTGDRKGGDF